MKNLEQFIVDIKADEELRKKFQEGLNKLRGDGTLGVMEAGQQVARELGYEVSDEEAKSFIEKMQNRGTQGKKSLSDDELDNAAGGSFCSCWLPSAIDQGW